MQLNWADFLRGAWHTLLFCCGAFPIAVVFGLALAAMSASTWLWLRAPARIYVEVIRGTPILAQLFLIYYGLGAVFAQFNQANLINVWTAGITTLALNYAAYEAEIFRAGIGSVETGQSEAALSLGMNQQQSLFRIVLPQAIPLMIPPLVNDFIYMLKDSAVVSAIAGTDLSSVMSGYVRQNTDNPWPYYVIAMLMYLALSLPMAIGGRLYEAKLRRAMR